MVTRHAIADGWLRRQPLTAREALPPPEPPGTDPVFGPARADSGYQAGAGPWRYCPEHEAAWRGDDGCWACEGAT